jgi:hypothetical protein
MVYSDFSHGSRYPEKNLGFDTYLPFTPDIKLGGPN